MVLKILGMINIHKWAGFKIRRLPKLKGPPNGHIAKGARAHSLSFRGNPRPKESKRRTWTSKKLMGANPNGSGSHRFHEEVAKTEGNVEAVSPDVLLADEGLGKADAVLTCEFVGRDVKGEDVGCRGVEKRGCFEEDNVLARDLCYEM